MDWAVFDSRGRRLEGPYEEFEEGEGGQFHAERAARAYPPDVGAWAAPVCDWHPTVPRESCPEYPHDV